MGLSEPRVGRFLLEPGAPGSTRPVRDSLDMAMVSIPNHDEDNMWELAHAVDDAEWELDIEI